MNHEQVWTFERNGERLIVRQRAEDGAFELETKPQDGPARVSAFEGARELAVFQNDLQYMLVHTGWTLLRFSPDRRRGGDRRGFPRRENDRRRWWTDGATEMPQPTSKRKRT
jgi:hypothetical protein